MLLSNLFATSPRKQKKDEVWATGESICYFLRRLNVAIDNARLDIFKIVFLAQYIALKQGSVLVRSTLKCYIQMGWKWY